MSFAGSCVCCGGPQVWTLVADEVWVACSADCESDQADLFGRNPPLIALCEEAEQTPKVEHPEEGWVRPLESSAANPSGTLQHEPPAGWLSTIWEGGPDGSS